MNREELQETRAARAQAGSRRKRDLQAAGMSVPRPDNPAKTARGRERYERRVAWAKKHLPEQNPNSVAGAIWVLTRRTPDKLPSVEAVIARMKHSGSWDRAT